MGSLSQTHNRRQIRVLDGMPQRFVYRRLGSDRGQTGVRPGSDRGQPGSDQGQTTRVDPGGLTPV